MTPRTSIRRLATPFVGLLLSALLASHAAASTRPDAPPTRPDAVGPWAVGRTTFIAVDPSRDDRTFSVDVWYPVDPEDAEGPPSVYDLLFTGIESPLALADPPASSQGPFPLVVFSHGSGGVRYQSWFLTETLASHGFVVAAPDHVGNTALDLIFPGPPFEARDRPLDVSLVITRMLEKNGNPADPFHQRVDASRIGVAGHSFGGFTSLAMAAGFDDVPPDPRVVAIAPISPASSPFSDDQLGSIAVPTLVLGGTADTVTPVEPESRRAFELTSGRPRYRLDVLDAGHNSFTNICDIADALLSIGLPPELLEFLFDNLEQGCAPELIALEEAHRLTNLYAVAFLRMHVADDLR